MWIISLKAVATVPHRFLVLILRNSGKSKTKQKNHRFDIIAIEIITFIKGKIVLFFFLKMDRSSVTCRRIFKSQQIDNCCSKCRRKKKFEEIMIENIKLDKIYKYAQYTDLRNWKSSPNKINSKKTMIIIKLYILKKKQKTLPPEKRVCKSESSS